MLHAETGVEEEIARADSLRDRAKLADLQEYIVKMADVIGESLI